MEYTTVSIPRELAERVEDTLEDTSFTGVSDLVKFLLRSLTASYEERGRLTEAEMMEVAERLRDLGYLE
ncbi:MAG: hypothetical protein MAG715_00119 [Methanonatronarchaeales archaeon]|nr:hypothetical protein [Methanonatronarchaeales archaeon]